MQWGFKVALLKKKNSTIIIIYKDSLLTHHKEIEPGDWCHIKRPELLENARPLWFFALILLLILFEANEKRDEDGEEDGEDDVDVSGRDTTQPDVMDVALAARVRDEFLVERKKG